MARDPFADPNDLAAVWRPLSDAEAQQAMNLLAAASSKLRHACPFDIDARVALFEAGSTDPTALDPVLVTDVVVTIVKRYMVNIQGAATMSQSVGPYSQSATFVNRYDKTGSDVRGAIQVTDSDIDQLRPAVPADIPAVAHVAIPDPQVLVPAAVNVRGVGPVVIPDYAPGYWSE